MEQTHESSGFRIAGPHTIRFAEVASRACPSEIFETRLAPMRSGSYMFYVESRTLERIVHEAILATILGTDENQSLDFGPMKASLWTTPKQVKGLPHRRR